MRHQVTMCGDAYLGEALHGAHQEDDVLHQVGHPHAELPEIVRVFGDSFLRGRGKTRIKE